MFDPISYKKARDVEDKLSLKTSQIEKDLKDYQATLSNLNPNQEAKQSVSDYGIVSLPKNSASGQASVNLKGQTATNLIKNGNFADGITGWTGSGCSISASNGMLVATGNGTRETPYSQQSNTGFKYRSGNTYYFRISARVKDNECQGFSFNALADGSAVHILEIQPTPTANVLYLLSGVYTATAEDETKDIGLRISCRYADASASNGKIMEIKDPLIVDITDFGITDVAVLDKLFANWFDGTKSVQGACRVRGVGRNLIDGKEFANKAVAMANDPNSCYTTQMDGRDVLAIRGSFFTSNIKPTYNFKPDTRYTVQVECKRQFADQESPYLAILYTDGTRTNLRAVSNTWGKVVFTSEAGKSVQGFTFVRLNDSYFVYYDYNTLKIEEGSQATDYEPYTESSLYLQGQELRGLPNGVRDEIRKSANGYELVQRVSGEYVLNGNSGFKFLDASFTNTYRMVLDNWIVGKNVLLGTNGSGLGRSPDGDYPVRGNTVGTDVRSLVLATNNYLYVYIEKAKVDAMTGATTEDKFKAYLNQYPITLTYQLATPITTPIPSSGTLLSNPSGTIYWEKAVADAAVYNNGVSVLMQDLPIESLDKLSKVDFETGLETELDASLAVIASDGLSFTHLGLQDGDIVFFTYYYDKASPIPEMSVEFYDSRYVIKDSVTEKFYKWNVKVENSVPSIDLVEV